MFWLLDLGVLKRIPKGKINLDLSQEMGEDRLSVIIVKKKGILREVVQREKDFKEKSDSDGRALVCEFGYDSFDALTMCDNSVKEMLIMDSGCSFHMTPN